MANERQWRHYDWNSWLYGNKWQDDSWQQARQWTWDDQHPTSWPDQGWFYGGWNHNTWSYQDSWGENNHSGNGRDARRYCIETTVEPPQSSTEKAEENESAMSAEHTSVGRPRKPKTGKEIIPAYDSTTPLRDYRRRVRLFLSTTGIDGEARVGRLVE